MTTNSSQSTPKLHPFHDFIRSRISVRRFQKAPVALEVIERVLETGLRAPSAHNRQPWRFAVLTTDEAKENLAEKMGADFRKDLQADALPAAEIDRLVARSRNRITQAPVIIMLCLSIDEMDSYPDRKRRRAEFRMAMQSVALAGGTILLAAQAEGLGGVWVCAPLFAQTTVQDALSLPNSWEPQGMLLLGYPESIPEPRTRKSLEEILIYV